MLYEVITGVWFRRSPGDGNSQGGRHGKLEDYADARASGVVRQLWREFSGF